MKVDRYRRGQIWWLKEDRNFEGSVQGGTRPVIIISNEANNRFCNNLTVVPCTTADKKELPTHFKLEINGESTALCECIKTVSKENITHYIGTCDSELIEKLDNCIKIALGLTDFYSYKIPEVVMPEPVITVDNINESDSNNSLTLKSKKGRKPYSDDYKIKFIDDYEHFDSDYMLDKYNLKDIKALQQRAYIFRKSLEGSK